MQFVGLINGWLRSWKDWFRMVLREGIARDVQQRRAGSLARRQQRMAHLAGQQRSRERQSSSQQPQQRLEQPVAGGEAAGRLGSTLKTICGAVQHSSADSPPQRLPSRMQPLGPSPSCLHPPTTIMYSCPPAEMDDGLREAVRRLTEAEAELAGLNKEKRDIHQFKAGSHDFGPNEIFFPFAGRWE